MSQRGTALAKGFIQELDGLRGIAILMVMVHRFWPRTGVGLGADMAGAGWIGVDLFFVISGFLITGILLDTKGDRGYFRNFYARRALRIFPLFYVFVIGVFVAFSHNAEFRRLAGSPLWYLFHLGNIPEGLLGNNVPYWIAPAWSLAIEEQFYLTFPLLVYVLDRRRLTYVLIGMIIAAPMIRLGTMLAMPDQERVQYLFTLCRIDTLAIGCLLAVAIRSVDVERWRARARIAAFVALPSVVVLAIASNLDRRSPFDRVFGYSIVAVGCASIVTLVILSRGSRSTLLLRASPLTYLGKLCFGLYLLHRPADTIVSAIGARIGIQRDLWLLIPKIGVAIVLATISWRFFERPFLALKDRFATARHPAPKAVRAAAVTVLLVLLAACHGPLGGASDSGGVTADPDAGLHGDGRDRDASVDDSPDASPDASVDAAISGAVAPVLYAEGAPHSPITAAIAARLQMMASAASDPHVFAKVGDSITVSPSFFSCFDGGPVDLDGRSDLAATRSYFGATPFSRISLAAKGGTTARDAITGSPSPLAQELAAIDPRIAVVMFGSNEARYDWTLDEFGKNLWNLIDATIAHGTIPIMSTIPANTGYPAADARIPTFNRVIRAIAQGRGVPLVDLHGALESLPDRGISSDGIHPTVAPDGGCVLTPAGLQYGYNVRNLLELEALGRTRAALAGMASDASAPVRGGSGTESDPFTGLFPLVDLGDTRLGVPHVDHGCGAGSGHEVAYRVSIPRGMTIDATVVDRPGTDVEVRILVGGVCLGAGSVTASATVPAGQVDVLVDARTTQDEGEFLLVVQSR
jgi:peptidoglycan/LPS O-acetylase OafA/YrhL